MARRFIPIVAIVLILIGSRDTLAKCSGGYEVVGTTCGSVPTGGCCKDGEARYWCDAGTLCMEPCPDFDCGWTWLDGYTCGTLMGVNSDDCPTIPPCTPCGTLSYAGCCDGKVLKWCESGCLVSINCGDNSPPNDTCGWSADYGFYECGEVGPDPSGVYPLACSGCTPSCSGKECGPDGCGGYCGVCPSGKVCQSGVCVSTQCTPDCTGKQCGDDGCGGSCGSCTYGTTCQSGKCVSGSGCGANQSLTCLGNCGDAGTGDCYCDDLCSDYGDCCPDFEECCGGCIPDCFGVECGDDGCGGSCGTCPIGEVCQYGWCMSACTPSCTGKQCGDDGCGGSCGTCPVGETCQYGVCVSSQCTPSCAGKECGPDGCGGYCGVCPSGKACQSGVCVSTQCIPDCTGRQCGDDGCGGSCGNCPSGDVCTSGKCVPGACTPDCEGKECGDDGCGGVCGVCMPPKKCGENWRCYDPHVCKPDCLGKECGDDGCGGSCGSCQPGTICELGRCRPTEDASPVDAFFDTSTPGASCPDGQMLYYGTCRPVAQASEAAAAGGCMAGSSSSTFTLMLLLLGLWWRGVKRNGLS